MRNETRAETVESPSLCVYSRLEDAREAWRALYDAAPVSPYQHYDYVRLWFDSFGAELEPRIVVASDDAGLPVALLPLAVRRTLGLRIAESPAAARATSTSPSYGQERRRSISALC